MILVVLDVVLRQVASSDGPFPGLSCWRRLELVWIPLVVHTVPWRVNAIARADHTIV